MFIRRGVSIDRAAVVVAAFLAVACDKPARSELVTASLQQSDTISSLRDQIFDQMLEGSRFVNEINAELAKANLRGTQPGGLTPVAEIRDLSEERRRVVANVTTLVERLHGVQGRVQGLRKQLADKDSAFAGRVAEFEALVVETQRVADEQRSVLQATIDQQAGTIAALSGRMDTLSRSLDDVSQRHNTVYFVAGTREELVRKGVLVPEGPRRFLVAGGRNLVPARTLDPEQFHKLDMRTDRTIILPVGEYKIVSRQNGDHVSRKPGSKGVVSGALTIDEPELFWSTSRYLIMVRS